MDFGTVQTINIGVAAAARSASMPRQHDVLRRQGTSRHRRRREHRNEQITNPINVITNGTTDASVAASAIAAGGVAVNAGVAEAINRTEAGSRIERGVTIASPNADITVSHDVHSEAKALIIAVALGGVSVNATVTTVVNKLDAVSYVGIDPDGKNQAAGNGSITAKSLTVNATG